MGFNVKPGDYIINSESSVTNADILTIFRGFFSYLEAKNQSKIEASGWWWGFGTCGSCGLSRLRCSSFGHSSLEAALSAWPPPKSFSSIITLLASREEIRLPFDLYIKMSESKEF